MNKKIIGIVICTMLLATTTTVIADWDPEDGWKMHFPQYPNPDGYDVDFGFWALGDDWRCTETGTVDDIHFWISWFYDDPLQIPFIKVSIWSNNPQGPGGYSQPLEKLWERSFDPSQFIIREPPYNGVQMWYMPWGEMIPQMHFYYWQVNIPEIEDPFVQQQGEVYWLVIQMPFNQEYLVGWKTTLDYYLDHAVWGEDPFQEWLMIDGIDLSFVITGNPLPECCLDITSVSGGLLDASKTRTVNAVIENIGTGPCINVSWSMNFTGFFFSGATSGVIPVIPVGGNETVSSKMVLGLALSSLFPGTVTITVDAENNACAPVTVTKNLMVFLLLLKVSA